MPFGYYHQNNAPGADHDQFGLGNPWFALLYLPDCECGLSRLSVGMGAPVARGGSDLERSMVALGRGVAGDWDGDGTDTVAVYRPSDGRFYIKLTNEQGVADLAVYAGARSGVVTVNP